MKKNIIQNYSALIVFFTVINYHTTLFAQTKPNRQNNTESASENPNLKWFRDAKFGIFVHWGLYSQLAGSWKGKNYYGSGEWLMYQGKIPYTEYAAAAKDFNPTSFNAKEWVSLVKEAGAKYLVVTAKHHEGFAMYDSKISDFNIVRASPFGKDPMKELSAEAHRQNLPFGFYYSQFLDWHEVNGGGNEWDFKQKKDYLKYYREKSIPQLKELMTLYGKLGLVWFDMPGGMNKEQTKKLIDTLHRLQPDCLFSSRVGQGLGDYIDLGDSEMPAAPIENAWEAIYTFNDSWGYMTHDLNFKTPKEIIQLIAQASSKGGNLMLNIGPDGKGRIPQICIDFLKEVGKWMKQNGESIYDTTSGFIPEQPWGVTTSKPGKLFLHVFDRPRDNRLLIPDFIPKVKKIHGIDGKDVQNWKQENKDLHIQLPSVNSTSADEVYMVEFEGQLPAYTADKSIIVSNQYKYNRLKPIQAEVHGNTKVSNLSFSHYFGDWKHISSVQNMSTPADNILFQLRVLTPGYYKVILDYAADKVKSGREGMIRFQDQNYYFKTLPTADGFKEEGYIPFVQHPVAIIQITTPGIYNLSLQPKSAGEEIFKLKQIILEPIE